MAGQRIDANGRKPTGRAVRAAIAGAGLMGRWHAHSALRAGAELTAIVDPEPEKGSALAGRHGIRAYPTVPEMLDATEADVLHIASPTGTHTELIETAFAAGLHVFVEKPLAGDAATTERLIARAAETGLCLAAVHQYAWQRSVEAIAAGIERVGRPVQIGLRFHSAGGADYADAALPGLAADILPHPVSILQRLLPGTALDDLDWRIGAAGRSSWRVTTELADTYLAIQISLAARPPVAELEVIGTEASFEADLFHDFHVLRPGDAGRRAKLLRPFSTGGRTLSAAALNLAGRTARREQAYPGLIALTRAFYRACRNEGAVPTPAADLMAVARLRDLFLRRADSTRRLAS